MKYIKLTSVFILSILISTFYSCENEPLDPNLQPQPPAQTQNTDCLAATQAYIAATTNFGNWDGEDATYSPLCLAYATSLQDLIDDCGDPSGSFQALLGTLGDCSEPLDAGTCETAIANSGIAATNLSNATANLYTQFCNAYVLALEDQIDLCGDTNGALQAIINGLGDCLEASSTEACDAAILASEAAETAYQADTTNVALCNAYSTVLQTQIDICGDADGSLQSVIDGLGDCSSSTNLILLKKISYSQNPNNNIEFFYNENNQLIKIQGTDGSSKRWTYTNGMVDRAQFYDASGNLSSDSEEKYIYVNGVITERRDSYNLDTTPVLDERYEYEFNNDGRLVESRYFGTNETEFSIKYSYTYNGDGNLTNYLKDYTNPAINDISNTISNYDDKNYFMKNINPRIVLMDDFNNDSNNNPGDGSGYTYNSDNFPTSLTNTNGDVTTYEYY